MERRLGRGNEVSRRIRETAYTPQARPKERPCRSGPVKDPLEDGSDAPPPPPPPPPSRVGPPLRFATVVVRQTDDIEALKSVARLRELIKDIAVWWDTPMCCLPTIGQGGTIGDWLVPAHLKQRVLDVLDGKAGETWR